MNRRVRAHRFWRDLRRTAVWHRRLLAAGLVAAAAAFAIEALDPAPPRGVPVLVAAHDLAAGARVGPDDVRRREVRVVDLPSGAVHDPHRLVARTLTGPVRAGEVITDVRLVGPSYLDAYGAALVAVPVRIADAESVRLLRPGDVVDVLAATAASAGSASGSAELVASAVRIVSVPSPPRTSFGGDASDGALVVLATTDGAAARLAGAAVSGRLSVVLRGG